MKRTILFFILGFLGAILFTRALIRLAASPEPKPAPAYKPIVTDAELAVRDRQVRECKSRGGTPVMGFNFTAICVKEFK